MSDILLLRMALVVVKACAFMTMRAFSVYSLLDSIYSFYCHLRAFQLYEKHSCFYVRLVYIFTLL